MLDALARNWWVLLVRGLAAILFGILAFMWPDITLWVLVVLFGVYALADGVMALYFSFSGRASGDAWWAMLLVGVLSLAAGVISIAWPAITAATLLILMAAWAIARGIFEIAAAIRLRKILANEWRLAMAGVLSIVFGAMLVLWPAAGLLALVWLIGAFAVLFGILEVMLSLRLRSLRREAGVKM